MSAAGVTQPMRGHSASGSAASHTTSARPVKRVYDSGMGVDKMRSQPPATAPISHSVSSTRRVT